MSTETKPQPAEPKLHRLAVLIDDDGSSIVHDAISLYHAGQDVRGRKSHEQNGDALVAICAAWLDTEHRRIQGAKGGAS